jgi:hypothetical protein
MMKLMLKEFDLAEFLLTRTMEKADATADNKARTMPIISFSSYTVLK